MRKLVRILTTVKTMGVVDVKRHVVKHVVDVVRTVKHLALCALFLSQAILRASILAARSAAAGCYAWALVPVRRAGGVGRVHHNRDRNRLTTAIIWWT